MKFINTRTEKYFLILILVTLIVLIWGRRMSQMLTQYIQDIRRPTINSVVIPQPEEISYEEYLQQGINYESVGELDKAIDAYQKAAQVKQGAYVPYSNLGSIYKQNKEFFKAEEAFKRALSIYGERSRTIAPPTSVYRKLYELYRYDLKQHPDQITLFFSNALEKTNNDVDLMKLYASYLEDVNDLESALAIWKAFLQAEPNNGLYTAKIKSLEARIAR